MSLFCIVYKGIKKQEMSNIRKCSEKVQMLHMRSVMFSVISVQSWQYSVCNFKEEFKKHVCKKVLKIYLLIVKLLFTDSLPTKWSIIIDCSFHLLSFRLCGDTFSLSGYLLLMFLCSISFIRLLHLLTLVVNKGCHYHNRMSNTHETYNKQSEYSCY